MKQATDWLQDPAALIGSLGKVKVQNSKLLLKNNTSLKLFILYFINILYDYV